MFAPSSEGTRSLALKDGRRRGAAVKREKDHAISRNRNPTTTSTAISYQLPAISSQLPAAVSAPSCQLSAPSSQLPAISSQPPAPSRELRAVAGSWPLEAGSWPLEAGSWPLEAGSWPLEAGSWPLEAGSWQLEADTEKGPVTLRPYGVFLMCALAVGLPRLAAAQSDLERARKLYNTGQYEQSIAAAALAKARPSAAASATVIIARSRLELFRLHGNADDLAAARSALVSLNPRSLAPQESIDWQIGVGTALFLENQLAPAAETFNAVLPSARERLPGEEFDKLLEWWAAAMLKLAETFAGDARKRVYERLREDAVRELDRNPLSRPPPTGSWCRPAVRAILMPRGARPSGWIRAGGPPGGQRLRFDLDTFVTQTLIPERAQARTGQRLDARTTLMEISALTDEWRALTLRWGGATP